MKLDTSERSVETSGFLEEKAFSIEANGKAFRILIDKMYSSIHTAIVRELMTNAWDAHVLAGNPKPFEIHIPTVFEPYFAIRDFGCAMTHDDVMNVYSNVFDSTKDHRDDQVGAWGLGSKTPFGYTDTFSVQVWLDDKHRVYSVFIDARGIPKIALALEEENDGAADGVEIKFPVAPKDAGIFCAALKTVSIGFDVKPIFSSQLDIPEFEILRSGKGWNTFKYKQGNTWLKQPLAKIGCVLYPIDFNTVVQSIASTGVNNIDFIALLSDPKGFRASAMIIDFPIGSLEITANRESLYYSEKTVKTIIDRFDNVIDDIRTDFKAGLKGSTLYEANMHALEVCHAFDDISPVVARYLRKYAETLKFKTRRLLRTVGIHHRSILVDGGTDDKGLAFKISVPKNYKTIQLTHYAGDKFVKRPGVQWNAWEDTSWRPTPTLFYVELKQKGDKWVPYAAKRIKHDRRELHKHTSHDLVWIRTPSLTDYAFLKAMAAFGQPTYKLVHDLPKPPGNVTRHAIAMRYWDIRRGNWQPLGNYDVTKHAGYYVMLTNNIGESFTRFSFMDLLNELIKRKAMRPLGPTELIIGVPKSRKGELNKSKNWVPLKQALVDGYKKTLDIKEASIKFSVDGVKIDALARSRLGKFKTALMSYSFDADSIFVQAAKAYDRLDKIEDRSKQFKEIWQRNFILDFDDRKALELEYTALTQGDPQLIQELVGIKVAIDRFAKFYPLLSDNFNTKHIHYAEYIEALDKLDKFRQDAKNSVKG